MSITELSVKRPATIIVFLIVLLGLGIIGYRSMGADLMPSVNFPVFTISTSYSGAGAEEIKKDILKPIEDAVSGISGVDRISASASEGFGTVTILFTMETDTNTAFMDVQKAVERVSSGLPKDANKPSLYKLDIGDMPVLTLTVTGNKSFEELYNEADKVKQKLEKINGVGNVSIQGGNKKQLFIKVDKTALQFYGININNVISKLRTQNTNSPVGQIEQESSNEDVKVVGEFDDINDLKNLRIPTKGNGSVRLDEISQIGFEYPKQDTRLTLNGNTTIGISIQKQSNANVISVVDKVKAELTNIKPTILKGVEVNIANDSTVFIKDALGEILRNVGEGIVVTALVLFLFLRSMSASIIVLIAIPTSLIATFYLMYINKFTINMMSLMALSLCIGILVDDSIVILENIQRHLGMGKSKVIAAIEGRKEIGMAAIAITLCDVVVFAPVAFMSGMMGQFFKEFGLTVVFATLFSLLVSFTITPMLASRFLKEHKKSPEDLKLHKINAGKFIKTVTKKYEALLLLCLKHRWKTLGLVTLTIILSIALIPLGLIKFQYMAQSDQSTFSIDVKLSPGSNLNKTDEKVKLIEQYLKTLDGVISFYTTEGNNNDQASASINVKLVPKNERKLSQSEIASQVRKWGGNLYGIKMTVNEAQMGGGANSGNNPIQINILGEDSTILSEISNKVEEIVKSVPGIIDVVNSTKTRKSELHIKIDPLSANEYGLSTTDISGLIRTALEGTSAGIFRENGSETDITVKFMDNQIKNSQDIGAINISGPSGNQIELNQIASIKEFDSAQSISRMNRQDVVRITANIQGAVLGDVNKEIVSKLSALNMPSGYSIDYGGSQKNMSDAMTPLIKALLASIVLVYLVLVVLYESFFTPIIRLLSLPCAIIGALLVPAITGKPLDFMSMIGLIMLDGLASKNGTLLIDYTNTLIKRGKSLKEALIEAGITRIRPIIMTSVTMIVGMLPVALSLGAGSEMKSGMATIIIGGMLSSTILTPILIPVAYTIFEDFKEHFSRKFNKANNTEVAKI